MKEIPVNTIIRVQNEEEDRELRFILASHGYKWSNGCSLHRAVNISFPMNYHIQKDFRIVWSSDPSPRTITFNEFKANYMESKEIKINTPEGYEIDKENSTFECIKFKKKALTYEDVAKKLFYDKKLYTMDLKGSVIRCLNAGACYDDQNNATSEKQLEKLLAINKLMNVAKYLNGDWKPDWNNEREVKYSIFINSHNALCTDDCTACNRGIVYFKRRELARQAINILGEDTIRLALSTDW